MYQITSSWYNRTIVAFNLIQLKEFKYELEKHPKHVNFIITNLNTNKSYILHKTGIRQCK